MSHPQVSIVIVNWNGADILPRCLEAVKAQTLHDSEVIVIDNASTDGSVEGSPAPRPSLRCSNGVEERGRLDHRVGVTHACEHATAARSFQITRKKREGEEAAREAARKLLWYGICEVGQVK